jgi:hypothetical protein
MRYRPINYDKTFIGDRDFGDSVQLDEVALQRPLKMEEKEEG